MEPEPINFWRDVSITSLDKIWDNNEDNIYAKLLDKEDTYSGGELSEYHKKTIEKAIKEADNGETVSHSEAMKKYKKWL